MRQTWTSHALLNFKLLKGRSPDVAAYGEIRENIADNPSYSIEVIEQCFVTNIASLRETKNILIRKIELSTLERLPTSNVFTMHTK